MAKLNERRSAPRFSLKIDCRFLLRGELESKGTLLDISTNGLAVITDSPAREGDHIVIYPDGVGRLTGQVARVFEAGFAVAFSLSESEKSMIGERIASVIAGVPYLRLSENRTSFRITYNIETSARLENAGEFFPCTIIDMSRAGCLLKSDVKPEIGERIVVGALRGLVRRHSDHGFAIEFLKMSRAPQPREPADRVAVA